MHASETCCLQHADVKGITCKEHGQAARLPIQNPRPMPTIPTQVLDVPKPEPSNPRLRQLGARHEKEQHLDARIPTVRT